MAGRFSVEAVFKAVDRVTAPVSRMQNRVGKFTRSMADGLRKVNRVMGKAARGMGAGIKSGAVVAGAALAGLGLAINGVADRADALAKRTRRLEFPIEEFQEWNFVAEQSGLTATEFDKAIEGMAKRMGEARAGTGSLYTFLKKTDKAFLRQLNSTTDVSQAMELMIGKMQKSKDPMERAALASAAFGRQGLKLANVAELGAEKIAQLRKEQRENGVITMKQAEAAENYNDAMNSLKKAMAGFLQTVILPMLPLITTLIRDFREWAVANREVISEEILAFGRNLVENFGMIVTWAKRIGAAIAVFFALAAALKVVQMVMLAVNLVMMANPIGLIVLAVVALIAAFSALWIWIEDIDAAFGRMPKALQILLAPLALLIKGIKFIKDNWDSIMSAASSVAEFLGFGGDDEAEQQAGGQAAAPQVQSPQDRVAQAVEERRSTSTAEVTIRDESGRAEVTGGSLGPGLNLAQSGAF
mgnify:CR=1 FL=1